MEKDLYQGMDFSIEKLSAPVEALDLDMRSCRLLRHASIYTVAEIIIAGKRNILSAKNTGPLVASRIFRAVAGYLGVSEELLSGEAVKQIASLQQRKPLNPLHAPVTALNLPSSTIRYLKSLGVFRIKELLKVRANDYGKILGLGEKDKRRVDKELSFYLAGIAQAQIQPLVETNSTIEPSIIKPPSKIDLRLILKLLGINERAWSVLELRATQLLTLEEIAGEIGGVSRQSVSEIIRQVHEKVRRKLNSLIVFFDYFEERSKVVRKRLGKSKPDRKTLLHSLLPDPASSNFIADEKEVEKLIALVRTLAIHQKPWFSKDVERRWKTFIFLSCSVDPALGTNKKGSQIIEKQGNKKKRQTHKELAQSVLAGARKPMHWSEIAKQAYYLSGRGSFKTGPLYESLRRHKELFVRVGRGTYELVEWGNKTVEFYTEIVASILRQENRPLPFDLIFANVSAIRSVKQSSLLMSLEIHPRFYKSIHNTYGLRGWLPAREKQNLRTPEWLIEGPHSQARVEKARARGYDVDRMIADDMLQ